MWPNLQETADLVFTEEIINGKLHFLCDVSQKIHTFIRLNLRALYYNSILRRNNTNTKLNGEAYQITSCLTVFWNRIKIGIVFLQFLRQFKKKSVCSIRCIASLFILNYLIILIVCVTSYFQPHSSDYEPEIEKVYWLKDIGKFEAPIPTCTWNWMSTVNDRFSTKGSFKRTV